MLFKKHILKKMEVLNSILFICYISEVVLCKLISQLNVQIDMYPFNIE